MPLINQTKERPILFSAPMVRAILSGQKTVTRRVTKVQPRSDADIGSYGKGQPFIRSPDVTKPNPECPYGRPGDRLWVRETWYCDHFEVMRGPYLKPDDLDIGKALNDGTLVYAADGLAPYEQEQPTWKPSIHMPRWASRILLEITDVRVERLQEISLAQVQREGCEVRQFWLFGANNEEAQKIGASVFSGLWSSINGAESWNANPWVWVVEFRRVTL
ncbi:hypothetical protein [Pseudomonas coronafaciens]|uniref:Phage-related protein n=1 Tax=Pseudomonas coronafaciens pv. striafaciens TaxID=235276 RepID=A0A3M4YKT9_9PSED|nr:hypothetical protein [Pseudomonas coronafaciens]RMR88856.1 hypothetical protein ALP78_02946 [Pseudomonas coronafaciens pv. striafaciens]